MKLDGQIFVIMLLLTQLQVHGSVHILLIVKVGINYHLSFKSFSECLLTNHITTDKYGIGAVKLIFV